MKNRTYRLRHLKFDFSNIHDAQDFHEYSMKLFGFPEFYGKNMYAWIDCLRSIRDPEDGLSSFIIEKDEILVLNYYGYIDFMKRNKDLAISISYSIGFCNNAHVIESGSLVVTYVVRN